MDRAEAATSSDPSISSSSEGRGVRHEDSSDSEPSKLQLREGWVEEGHAVEHIEDDKAHIGVFVNKITSSSPVIKLESTESGASLASKVKKEYIDLDLLDSPPRYSTTPHVSTKECGKQEEFVGAAAEHFHSNQCDQSEGREARELGFLCTACGRDIPISKLRPHPQLGVGICDSCNSFLFSSPFTKDPSSGSENECRWCGDGGDVILCDTCERSFCKACILRNFGTFMLNAIVKHVEWRCFYCNPKPLEALISNFEKVMETVMSKKQFASDISDDQQHDSPRKRKMRPSRVQAKYTRNCIQQSPDDTIQTIIERAKEEMKRKSPNTSWTGFDLKSSRRPNHSRHYSNSAHPKRMRHPVMSEHGAHEFRASPISKDKSWKNMATL